MDLSSFAHKRPAFNPVITVRAALSMSGMLRRDFNPMGSLHWLADSSQGQFIRRDSSVSGGGGGTHLKF